MRTLVYLSLLENKLKVLTSLSQKALWRVGGLILPPSWTSNTTGKESGPNPHRLRMRNTVNPYPSRKGKLLVRGAYRDAGKGTRRKQRPSCNGMDRDWTIIPRESGQTSARSFMTRLLDQMTQEEKQMTAEPPRSALTDRDTAGASFHGVTDWHAIDWHKADHNVRRLQARIVKATEEKRWGKVKALQRLLTHSFSGKAFAVRRVTENQGKNTPGVDKVTWNTPQKKINAVYSLRQRDYHPRPMRRVYIPKKNGKKRPLGIPVMKCRAMQALYLLALDPIAETTADPNSYGFRQGRSTADAIEQCFCMLAKQKSPQWILEGDIKGCFDAISHEWLLTHIPMEKAMLKKWLKAGYMEQHILYPTEAGTPQGGIISPVLANMTLDGLERAIHKAIPPTTRKSREAKVHLIRYADDFLSAT